MTSSLTREFILKKIKRWSSENDNKTPGQKAFFRWVGGIGIYDLKRLGWTYYGELVKEAGLTPNKFDKTKYTKGQLCEIFLGVMREKNVWPSRSILDVKHLQDSNFPESSTFYKKLGRVKQLSETILDYAESNKEFDDVIEICKEAYQKFKGKDIIGDLTGKEPIHGWVYLIKHGSREEYRVGQTYDSVRREKEIRIQLPERAVEVHKIETVDPVGVEAYWLNRFSSKRMNGDWFKLTSADVKEFMGWKDIA